MTAARGDWMDLERYLPIHDRCMEHATTYFVERSTIVAPDFDTNEDVRIQGDLFCKGGLVLHVVESFEYDSRHRIRLVNCRYQAQFVDPPLRQVFRYDNAHVYAREGHPDAFHKHVFDNRTWREFEVEHIGKEQFPTLQDVIDELYDWWLQHRGDVLIYP